MAPIYTAAHTSSQSTPTPLFKLRGLDNYAPTRLSNLSLHGIPLERQVAYTQYKSSISSFVYASATNKRIRLSRAPHGLITPPRYLPLDPPTTSFAMRKEPATELADKILSVLGPAATKNKVGRTTVFTAPNLPTDQANRIINLSAPHFNSGRETVNPTGLKAFHFLSGCLAEILRVHSYPAFSTESDESYVEFLHLVDNKYSARHQTFDKKVDASQKLEYSETLAALAEIEPDGDDTTMEDSDEDAIVQSLRKAKGFMVTSGKDTVTFANPPTNPTVNVGSTTSVPNEPGCVFPYFPGLIQPDASTLLSFITNHLFDILGSTRQECQNEYTNLRRGVNSLANTDVGMALTHIAFGVDLAIQTQGRCFVIVENRRYAGFALLGARLAIFDSVRWVSSGTAEELRDNLVSLDPHTSAVRKLVVRFGELTTSELYSGPAVSAEMFENPNLLAPILKGLKLAELGDTESELNTLFRSLNYMGPGYLARNPQVVAEILEKLFSDSELELARPTYIASVRSDISSRAYKLLSRFGPEAWSLWDERGSRVDCVAGDVKDRNGKRKVGEVDVYANLPEKISVLPRPLDVAVRDMDKVMKEGGVKIDQKARSGRHRSMMVESEEMRKRIWKVLVEGLKESSNSSKKQKTRDVESASGGDYDDELAKLFG